MKILNIQVAGTRFHWKEFVQAKVIKGDNLVLKPEPENKYDEHAIAVYKGGLHIGYVPRRENVEIFEALIQRPEEVQCVVTNAWNLGCWVVVNIKEQDGQDKTAPAHRPHSRIDHRASC